MPDRDPLKRSDEALMFVSDRLTRCGRDRLQALDESAGNRQVIWLHNETTDRIPAMMRRFGIDTVKMQLTLDDAEMPGWRLFGGVRSHGCKSNCRWLPCYVIKAMKDGTHDEALLRSVTGHRGQRTEL